MTTAPVAQTLSDLETKFWQAMVDQDTESAIRLLANPALMVSSHGAMEFEHERYGQMSTQGSMVMTAFELSNLQVHLANESPAILTYRVKQVVAPRAGGDSLTQDMLDTSTWVRDGADWRCVMHSETSPA
jgi:hypothetical protein